MIPYATSIVFDNTISTPIYLQLCAQIIGLIKTGILIPSSKLPGTRIMAEQLNLNRNTIVAAYDELLSQGWIEIMPSKGAFVSGALPIVKLESFSSKATKSLPRIETGFIFHRRTHLHRSDAVYDSDTIFLDEGVPDNRLAPIEELAKTYRNIVKKKYNRSQLSYGSFYGSMELRKTLVGYLNETRGLQIEEENVLITRGSQMGIYLATQLLLYGGNTIIVGETNYRTADITCIEAGGKLLRIPVDREGLVTDAIEKACQVQPIKAVYVTSHHHHPTTVTLSAQRRMQLLELARIYNFAIIEDDYDYDFHYNNAPILPLASHDHNGNVVYTGALCKIVAPAIRIGYLIAAKSFIDEAARLRAVVDRQGDMIMEIAMAKMIKAGDIQRHSKKALRLYKKRRDLCCQLFREKLSDYFEFETPEGGMAIWLRLNKKYHWDTVISKALKQSMEIPNWRKYDAIGAGHNGIRFGFASHDEEEIREIIRRLVIVMGSLEQSVSNH